MTMLGPEWGPVTSACIFIGAKLAFLALLYVLKV